jgi:hypothetical protein
MNTWKNITVVIAVLALFGFGFWPTASAQEEKNVEQMIVEAKTPADHEAIAIFYEEESQTARQKQAEHERMKAAYQSHYPIKRAAMVPHCESIIKKYKEMAEEYAALAQLHKDMATADQ